MNHHGCSKLVVPGGSSPLEFKVKLSVLVIAVATTQVFALMSGF